MVGTDGPFISRHKGKFILLALLCSWCVAAQLLIYLKLATFFAWYANVDKLGISRSISSLPLLVDGNTTSVAKGIKTTLRGGTTIREPPSNGICQVQVHTGENDSSQPQMITCQQQFDQHEHASLGNVHVDKIADDFRLIFKPASHNNVTILFVLVGNTYAKDVLTSENFIRVLSWAAYHGYGLVADTRSFCVMKKDMPFLSIGPYVELCNDASVQSRWYAKHGWRWAWTKPWAVLRFALEYLQQYQGDEKAPPHYIYYMDGEAYVRGHNVTGPSLLPLFQHREKIAKENANLPLAYPWVFQSREFDRGGGVLVSHSDQFLLDVSSPIVHRFLKRWINHSDCEAWVEQGSYYIETLRTLEESSPNINYAIEDEGRPCGRKYSPDARKGTLEWLNRSICQGENKPRPCTSSTPTSMACAAFDFDRCFVDGTRRLQNISATNQPPPILFYPRDLWPIATKGKEKPAALFNFSGFTTWLESSLP